MGKVLFTTVAVAALSCAGFAAQAQDHQGGVGGQGASHQEQVTPGGPRGAMGAPEHGAGTMRHDLGQGAEPRRGEEPTNRAAEQQRGGENRSAEDQRRYEHDRAMGDQRGGEVRTGRAVEENEGGRGHVQIDAGRRSRIVETIRRTRVETINHVDFAINVGTVVPPRYHFYPLPPEIVTFVPEYSGYEYIVVGNQILIIDPVTYRIVDVIDEMG